MNRLYDRDPRTEWTPDHARLAGYTRPADLEHLTPLQLDALHERVEQLTDHKLKPLSVIGC